MRSDGYKTKGKQNILAFLEAKKNQAVSVQDISDYLAQQGEPTNITTIYRRLDKLILDKKVIRHSNEDGRKGLFQYIADDSACLHHLHIQCTSCSKIIHLGCEVSKDFTEHLLSDHGIQLDYQKTVLYGLCDECREKNNK